MASLEMKLELAWNTISSIINYQELVKNKMIIFDATSIPEDIENYKFEGIYGHKESLQKRLNFLEHILQLFQNGNTLGENHILSLWEACIQRANFSIDKDIFLEFLGKEKCNENERWHLFSSEQRLFIFEKIFCQTQFVDPATMSQKMFQTYQKFFSFINNEAQATIQGYRNHIQIINYKKLNRNGMNTLWDIVLQANDEKVQANATNLLVQVHQSFSQNFNNGENEEKITIWENFVNQCIKQLSEPNERTINAAVSLLIKFFNLFEGKDLDEDEEVFSNATLCTVLVESEDEDNVRHHIKVPYDENIKYLRHKIAEAFNYSSVEFELSTDKFIYPPACQQSLKEIGLNQRFLVKKKPTFESLNHPKHLLAKNQDFFNKMFELLSAENVNHDNIWSLLLKLPMNQIMQQSMKELNLEPSKENWSKLIDGESMHKLHYSLKIIKKLMIDVEWKKLFTQKQGLAHLVDQLCAIDLEAQITSSLHFSCMKLYCDILFDFIMNDPEERGRLKELDNGPLIVKIIDLMVINVMSYEIQIQKRGESFDVLKQKQAAHDQKANKIWNNQNYKDEEDEESNPYTKQMNLCNKYFMTSDELFKTCIQIINLLEFQMNPDYYELFYTHQHFEKMIRVVFVRTDNQWIRNTFSHFMQEIYSNTFNYDHEKKVEFRFKLLHFLSFSI